MAEILTPDICVIGGGPGAANAALAAAACAVPVVLVEPTAKSDAASKLPSFIAAARRAAALRDSGGFGISAGEVAVDFVKVRAHAERAVAALAPNESPTRLAGLGVRIIEGEARFADARTVAIDGHEIRARRFIIAVAARSVPPAIPGLDSGPILTADNIFALGALPEQLIVLGAGTTGLELAQAFRRLGSAVTVLEAAEPLGGEDEECARLVLAQLTREGVVLRSRVKIARIEHAAGRVRAVLGGGGGDNGNGNGGNGNGGGNGGGSHLLVATGSRPVLDGLALEAAGIKRDGRGLIEVNETLKTSNKRVYAIGAAIGRPRAAVHHAGLAIGNALFRARIDAGIESAARVTLTEPELAQAGLTEVEARGRGIAINVARWSYHDNRRAQAERTTHGHVKVITTPKGKVLGVTVVGAQAGELIGAWVLAIKRGFNIRAFTDIALPAPTLSEIGKNAALDFFVPRLTRPWTRRIIAWLRLLG